MVFSKSMHNQLRKHLAHVARSKSFSQCAAMMGHCIRYSYVVFYSLYRFHKGILAILYFQSRVDSYTFLLTSYTHYRVSLILYLSDMVSKEDPYTLQVPILFHTLNKMKSLPLTLSLLTSSFEVDYRTKKVIYGYRLCPSRWTGFLSLQQRKIRKITTAKEVKLIKIYLYFSIFKNYKYPSERWKRLLQN